MAYYAFYQDRKVTCWERTHFEVQADTYEEALAMLRLRQCNSAFGLSEYLFSEKPKPYFFKTYTFYARNVYVFIVKRIHFVCKTYTFHSGKLYLTID